MKNRDTILRIFDESDMEFYEKFLSNLTEEEFTAFLEENPEFLVE